MALPIQAFGLYILLLKNKLIVKGFDEDEYGYNIYGKINDNDYYTKHYRIMKRFILLCEKNIPEV